MGVLTKDFRFNELAHAAKSCPNSSLDLLTITSTQCLLTFNKVKMSELP